MKRKEIILDNPYFFAVVPLVEYHKNGDEGLISTKREYDYERRTIRNTSRTQE
jgi:hypothetical protein